MYQPNTHQQHQPKTTNTAIPNAPGFKDELSGSPDFVEFSTMDCIIEPEKDALGFWLSIAVEIKHHGIWRIHLNDPDKYFPSDFHADRVDKPEKLDLYNGAIYSKTNGQYLGRMSPKDMLKIQAKLEAKGRPFLKTKFENRDKFTYLN